MKTLDTLIIGAGPIGLAAAVRLLPLELSFSILEKGKTVGNHIVNWGHIELFSNWEESVDTKSIDFLQKKIKIDFDLEDFPTGNQFIKNYLSPLAKMSAIKKKLQLNSTVVKVTYE